MKTTMPIKPGAMPKPSPKPGVPSYSKRKGHMGPGSGNAPLAGKPKMAFNKGGMAKKGTK